MSRIPTKQHALVSIPGSVKTFYVSLARGYVEGRHNRADGTTVYSRPTEEQRIAAVKAAWAAIAATAEQA